MCREHFSLNTCHFSLSESTSYHFVGNNWSSFFPLFFLFRIFPHYFSKDCYSMPLSIFRVYFLWRTFIFLMKQLKQQASRLCSKKKSMYTHVYNSTSHWYVGWFRRISHIPIRLFSNDMLYYHTLSFRVYKFKNSDKQNVFGSGAQAGGQIEVRSSGL